MESVIEVLANRNGSRSHSDVDNFVPWDNPDNVITFETFSATENAFTCYFNPLIFCISIPANVLNCIVFFLQGSYIRSLSPFSLASLSFSLQSQSLSSSSSTASSSSSFSSSFHAVWGRFRGSLCAPFCFCS